MTQGMSNPQLVIVNKTNPFMRMRPLSSSDSQKCQTHYLQMSFMFQNYNQRQQ